MKQKILIVTEYFYPEEFKINEIVLEWQKKGYDVEVLTNFPTYPAGEIFKPYKNRWYQKDDYEGVTVHRIKSVTGYKEHLLNKLLKYFVFMFLGSFFALRHGKKYDYIFGFNMAALTGMFPAVLIKKIYNKPLTFWAQDIWPDSVYAYGFKKTKLLAFFLEGFVKFMYHNLDAIAISGKGFSEKLKPYIKKDLEFYYLPNWADELDMNLEPIVFSEEKKVHFTFAGNVGKVQNLENIIMAFNDLSETYQEKSQLNIVGDGSALEALKVLNQKENVVFHGRKPRNDMAKYFKASDFLIVSLIDKPIFSVTVPAKTQTYIAAKKPILAMINGDAAEIISDNNLGYVASPNNIEEIKKIFIEAIESDTEKINSFTKNCDALTKSTFNRDVIIQKLLDLTVNA